MITYNSPQGSPEWLAEREGVITASRFRECREKTKGGAPSSKATLYAMNVARERVGGKSSPTFVNAAMKFGTEQEPIAREYYEAETGHLVYGAGFICTDDRKFGVSVDGLVGDDGIVEIKTMVSSDTLFTAMVERDISAYTDQVNGALWLLGRKWCDLILWAPDLPEGAQMMVRRIERNDNDIEALESDLLAFEAMVSAYAAKLGAVIKMLMPVLQPSEAESQPEAEMACEVNEPDTLTIPLFGDEPANPEHAALERERLADLTADAPKRDEGCDFDQPAITQPAASMPVSQDGVDGNPIQSQPVESWQPSDATVETQRAAEVAPFHQPMTLPAADVLTASEPATLKGGDIAARLGFALQAAFIADTLGVPWRATNGAAKLWAESDFARIKAALIKHIEAAK